MWFQTVSRSSLLSSSGARFLVDQTKWMYTFTKDIENNLAKAGNTHLSKNGLKPIPSQFNHIAITVLRLMPPGLRILRRGGVIADEHVDPDGAGELEKRRHEQ